MKASLSGKTSWREFGEPALAWVPVYDPSLHPDTSPVVFAPRRGSLLRVAGVPGIASRMHLPGAGFRVGASVPGIVPERPVPCAVKNFFECFLCGCDVPSPLYSEEKVADMPDEGVFERVPRDKSLAALGGAAAKLPFVRLSVCPFVRLSAGCQLASRCG